MEGERAYYAVDVEEAAAVLHETPDRIRQMLLAGELEGIPPGASAEGSWKVLLPASPDLEPPAPVDEAPEPPIVEQEEVPATDEGSEEFVASPQGSADAEELHAETAESPPGEEAATDREPTAPSGWASTQQAARALGISPRTVRWHIEQGNIEAKPEGEGVRRSWLVSIDSLQEFRDTRRTAGEAPRGRRAPGEGADIAAGVPGNAVRQLADRLAEEAARAAEYRVRLELTEQAASTVRTELEEERRRREAAERERDELRRRLESRPEPRESPPAPAPAPERVEARTPPVGSQRGAVPRSWWRRMFGG
jgi:helix-turn-helix protein